MAGTSGLSDELYSSEAYIPMDLYTASSLGCEDCVRRIIEEMDNKDDINKQNKGGWSPLMYASYSGDRVVSLLLDEGASVSLKKSEGITALMLAGKSGNTKAAATLIENGADVDACDLRCWTALFHAVSSGHWGVFQLLIEKGCQVNIKDIDGITPLMLAAEGGHEAIVKELLDHGAYTSSCSKAGQNARDLAVINGHVRVQNAIDAHVFLKQNSCFVMKNKSYTTNLPALLGSLGLSKYYPIFEKNGIDFDIFRTLTDDDLKEMGISLLGPRKKILSVITKWNENEPSFSSPHDHEVVQLIEESRKLQKQLEEMNMLLSVEQRLRITSEKQLKKTLEALKCLSDKVNRSARQGAILLHVLRESLNGFKQIMHSSATEAFDNWALSNTHGKVSNAFQFIDDLLNEMCRNNESLHV